MSTASNKKGGCGKTLFYLLLGGAVLWAGWHDLQRLYYALSCVGANTLLALDLSAYGQLTEEHWPGYVLLGLGLGAAGGTVAAQRRFEMARSVAISGWIALVVLLATVYTTIAVGNKSTKATTLVEPSSVPLIDTTSVDNTPVERAPTKRAPVKTSPTITSEPETNDLASRPDTSSVATKGQLRVIAQEASLRTNWADSLASPVAYLKEGDTVQLRRRTHDWVQVETRNASSGWVRITQLGPLKEAAEPIIAKTTIITDSTSASLPSEKPSKLVRKTRKPHYSSYSSTDSVAPPAWHPLGHQYHIGQVSDRALSLILDWQPNGELSGSCYYNQHPTTIYRLTGATKASGELHLSVFRRGRLAARCVLQRQDNGYTGTMFNTDGQQLPMHLE